MRIAIIIYNITFAGGTERASINLGNMLHSKGYEIIFISLNSLEGNSPFYDLDKKIGVIHLGLSSYYIPFPKRIIWYFSAVKVLKALISKMQPDILIGEGHNINSILPFIKVNRQMSIIGCEHIVFKSIPLISRLIMKLTYHYLSCIVVLSQQAMKNLVSLNKNIIVIPNMLSFFPEKKSNLSEKRILMVGRLSIEKGYDRLYPIAKELKKRFPDWRIDVFGEGDQKSELEELYDQNNVKDYITINKATKDIETEYLNSSIYLITSYSEAMPMVLMEAKSCGLPIVGYECEGTNELIQNNEDGFVIKDGNIDEFVEKVSILIDERSLRNKMAMKARENALAYSPGNIINNWDLLLSRYNR